jgi:glutamyl-tRNA synthetase
VARGRFAPSPTGWLHLGNARTALVAWARARAAGASFVMRVEDLDRPRTVEEAVTGNLSELRWLGLDWDEGPDVGGPRGPYRQSEREERYAAALERLEREGRTFACYLSRKDLRELASAPHDAGPVYGPRERAANARWADVKRREGKAPATRLRMPAGRETVGDLLMGTREVDLATEIGDLVLRRADGAWAYHLAVVVDDAAMDIGEVVRGDDLRTAAAGQAVLHRLLGSRPPRPLHVPLLHGPDGTRLAKRRGDLTLRALREEGVPAERVVGLLAWTLGQRSAAEPLSAAELASGFDPARIPRHPVALSPAAVAYLRGGPAPGGAPPAAPGHGSDAPVDSR